MWLVVDRDHMINLDRIDEIYCTENYIIFVSNGDAPPIRRRVKEPKKILAGIAGALRVGMEVYDISNWIEEGKGDEDGGEKAS